MAVFAVFRQRGPAWDGARAIEAQPGWRAHADFMNGLHHERLVILGGPLDGIAQAMLIVQTDSEAAIRRRLAADPWSGALLVIERIAAWDLRLGSLAG